jgi:tRNA(Ile)-lysidine synthase
MSANTVAIRSAVRNALTDCSAGDLILVAVSGGADSLALAYALSLEAPKLALRIEGVTVDHQLQSQSSVQAEKVVAALSKMGIQKTHVIKVDVDITDGLEASARRARYAALDACAEKTGALFILLGHTRDDQSESVLLGLARGSGARSLSAMAMRNGKYVRPLLAITREETLAACAEAQLDPWDDPHNADKTFTRVRVRHDVIPNLEKNLGPGISAALARTASLLRDDADALDQLADEEFAAHEPLSLDINRLEKLPKAIRTRVLRMAIYAAGAPSGSLSADHIAPIEAFITDWRGQGPSDLPGGVRVSRISGRLSLSR